MTVEHRAAPGLNDIEIELADDGEGLALRLRRQVPDEATTVRESPEERIVQALADAAQAHPDRRPTPIKYRDNHTIDYRDHAQTAAIASAPTSRPMS